MNTNETETYHFETKAQLKGLTNNKILILHVPNLGFIAVTRKALNQSIKYNLTNKKNFHGTIRIIEHFAYIHFS